jgi:Tol biopolymer transport system component
MSFLPRVRSRAQTQTRRPNSTRPFQPRLDWLEARMLMSVQPLTLADPSLWGVTGLHDSSHPSISGDGQLIAFQSVADNLVANDTNGVTDVFVFNRTTGVMTLASVGYDGMAGGPVASYSSPVISPDGRYVAFEGESDKLVPGVIDIQLFLRDLQTGTTSLLSVNSTGTGGGNAPSTFPVFSADSHHVSFLSASTNLVDGISYATFYGNNLFERDLITGTTRLVSVSLDGLHSGDADSGSFGRQFSMSADGRFVAFESSAQNLVGQQEFNIREDIFVRDVVAGTTVLASVNSAGTGTALNGVSTGPSLSADGRFVAFISTGDDLANVTGQQAYLRDLLTGVTSAVSVSSPGTAAVATAGAIISPDGRYVAFTTVSPLVDQDSNGISDVYVYDTAAHSLSLASINRFGTNGGDNVSGFTAGNDGQHGGLVFSADGRSLVFRSLASDLTPGVTTAQGNLYIRDLPAGTTRLLAPNQAGSDGANDDVKQLPALSADGRYVAFGSLASNLVANDVNGQPIANGLIDQQDIFVRDVLAGTTALVSGRSPFLPVAHTARTWSRVKAVSADGRQVVFESDLGSTFVRSDFAPGVRFDPAAGVSGIFVRDRQTGSIRVVDVDPNGVEVGAFVGNPQQQAAAMTPDGRYVLFLSSATTIVPGITYTLNAFNLFIRDLQSNMTRIVSVDPTGTHDIPVAGDTQIAVSDDGRYVAFATFADGGLPGVNNPHGNKYIVLRDMGNAVNPPTTLLVSHNAANDGQINGNSSEFSISADGRYVAFRSTAADLTAVPDRNNRYDVFRWDRDTGQVDLVSINHDGNETGVAESSPGYAPVMSSDGRYIVFSSEAYDLASPRTDPAPPFAEGIFRRDMGDGVTPPSTALIAEDVNFRSYAPNMSADGSRVVFFRAVLAAPPPPETNPVFTQNVLLWDGSLHLVSANVVDGGPGNRDSFGLITTTSLDAPLISADGRYVAFSSSASNLVDGFVDGNGAFQSDIYVRDLEANATKLITFNESGTASGNSSSHQARGLFSRDGSTFVFDSVVGNLFAGDRNEADLTSLSDVFSTTTAGSSSISGLVFDDQEHIGTGPGLEFWTVFLDANSNGTYDPNEDLAISDSTGHYAFRNLTPGTYEVAIAPQAGYQRTVPAAQGSYIVTILTDGSTIAERDFGEIPQPPVPPQPDLITTNVTFAPANRAPGEPLDLMWLVTNQGNGPAAGDWQDAVYLSTSPTIDATSIRAATVPHLGGLVAGANYSGSITISAPASPQSYYVVVESDTLDQVPEGTNILNNVASSVSQFTVVESGPPASDAGPRVTGANVTLDAARRGIVGAVFRFDVDLAAASAQNVASFTVTLAGKDNRFASPGARSRDDVAVAIRSAVYDALDHEVTLLFARTKAIKLDQLLRLTAESPETPGAVGIRSSSDVALDGDEDDLPGGDFSRVLGVGTKLSYTDSNGDRVSLALTNGGLMELVFPASGNPTLELIGTVPGRSNLNGSVKRSKTVGDGRTPLQSITGATGVIRSRLPVCGAATTNCFDVPSISAVVVDHLLEDVPAMR